MKYFTYVLQSEKDNKFYYGSTNNIERRVCQHKLGLVESTKHRRPIILIGTKPFEAKEDAIEFERHLKKCKNKKYILKLINLAPSYRG